MSYTWTLTSNTADANLLGATTNASVDVIAMTNGSFTLECLVELAATNELASTNITVNSTLSASTITNQTVCSGTEVTITTEPIGTGVQTFVWRKGAPF